MASCYGNSSSTTSLTSEQILSICSYLPFEQTICTANGQAALILTTFTEPSDFEQGFELMNEVIVEGKTWPFLNVFETMDAYKGYFHSHAAFAVKFKDQASNGSDILGCFYVKPNFPGRCSHVCNGGFITNKNYRGLGVGAFMGEHFKKLAKDLGYRASLFNLVFASNVPSVKLWRNLGYKQIATIPKVAVLEGEDGYVDAYQFYCDFYEQEA